MGKLQDVQQPREKQVGKCWGKYEEISTSYLDAYLAGKIGTGECQWSDNYILHTTYLTFLCSHGLSRVLAKTGRRRTPALYIRHDKGKNSSTCERSTKVSGNMDKQSGCLPLKIDTQWRCFYYSMNTSLFLVSISSVLVTLFYKGHRLILVDRRIYRMYKEIEQQIVLIDNVYAWGLITRYRKWSFAYSWISELSISL
jgi:hypothetical protein